MPQPSEADERVLSSIRCTVEREREREWRTSLVRANVVEQPRDHLNSAVRPTSIASHRERTISCDRDSANASVSVTQLSIDIDGDTGAFEDDVEVDAGVEVDSDSCVFANSTDRYTSTPASGLRERERERERDEADTSLRAAATVRHLSLDSLQTVGCNAPTGANEEEDDEDEEPAAADSSGDELSVVSLPTPPDGGWGWVVVFAAFMVNMIVDGISCSYGVFFMILEEEFGASKSQTALVGSLFWGVPLLAAPLSAPLINKFGCRAVCMAGALVAFVGVFFAQYATSLELLCVWYGLVAGLGLSMVALPSTVVVSYYFESRRAFATGLSVAGSGVGTFVLAPLTEYLVANYDWRSYMLLLSGIVLNLAVCGALLRPIETKREKKQRKLLSAIERFSKQCSKDASLQSSLQSITYQHSDVPTRLLFIRQALTDPKTKPPTFCSLKPCTVNVVGAAETDGGNEEHDYRVTLLAEPAPPTAAVTPLQAIPEHEVVEQFTDAIQISVPHSHTLPVPMHSTEGVLETDIDEMEADSNVNVGGRGVEIGQPLLIKAPAEVSCLITSPSGTICTTVCDTKEGSATELRSQRGLALGLSRSSEDLSRHNEDASVLELIGSGRRRKVSAEVLRSKPAVECEDNRQDNGAGSVSINTADLATTSTHSQLQSHSKSNHRRASPLQAQTSVVKPLSPTHSGSAAIRARAVRPKVFGQHLSHGSAVHRLRRGRASAGPSAGEEGEIDPIRVTQFGTGTVLLPASLYSRAQFAPLNRRDIFYRGTLENVPLYRSYKTASCPELYQPASPASDLSSSTSSRDDAFDRLVYILRLRNAKQVIKVMLDVKLFGNLAYLFLFLSNLLLFVGYNVAYFFLTDYAVSRQVSAERAPLLVSLIGILNTAGQVVIGYVGDRPEVNTVLVYAVCIGITGASTLLVPSLAACESAFVGLAVYAGLFGFFVAANVSLGTIIMVEAIGLERLTNGFSLMMCGQGVANIIGPPLLGWIIAQSGDFPAAFYAGGVLLVASAALIVFVPLLHRPLRDAQASDADEERYRLRPILSRTPSGKEKASDGGARNAEPTTAVDSRVHFVTAQAPIQLVLNGSDSDSGNYTPSVSAI